MKLSALMNMPATVTRSDDAMWHVFDTFRLNQSVINHVQQLLHLMADIQRHRACSLAILSGNVSFEAQVRSLNRKINARLSYLDAQPELTEILDQREWDNVLGEWKVVGYGWRKDNVLHNFELHSHLVEKILNIVRESGRWVLRSGNYSEAIADHYLGHAVFEYVFSTHLYRIETLGKLRGLGTHAVNGECGDDMRIRINYLLQSARHEQLAARDFFAVQTGSVMRNIPALLDVQRTENLFNEWLELMAGVVAGTVETGDATSTRAFGMASSVIDAHLAVTEQVLAYLQLAIEEMLEAVLEETAASED